MDPISSPTTPSSRVRPAWTTGTLPNTFAALPSGLLGQLAGTIMRRSNLTQQREVLGILTDLTGRDVLEVGCGPGTMLGLLSARPGVGRILAVDPSTTMRRMAVRTTTRAIADGRILIGPGDAERTGLPDGCVDVVVSVNTVAIWPDLDAGCDELLRVLRPGGRIVLSWHGGSAPPRAVRSMQLSGERSDRVLAALTRRCTDVRRELTGRCTVFSGTTISGSDRSDAGSDTVSTTAADHRPM